MTDCNHKVLCSANDVQNLLACVTNVVIVQPYDKQYEIMTLAACTCGMMCSWMVGAGSALINTL